MEVLGDDLSPEPPLDLCLLSCSGVGLDSLLTGLDDSEPGFRLPERPIASRLDCGSDTGSW